MTVREIAKPIARGTASSVRDSGGWCCCGEYLCGPGAEVYYRSCSAFQGKTGQEFAKASAKFWRAKVIGHTKIIGLSQPGQKTVKPGEEPAWPESEGSEEPQAKKPIGIGAGQKPKKD